MKQSVSQMRYASKWEQQERERERKVVTMKSYVFWNRTPCSPVMSTDLSEEHISSIFRVEETAKQ
jgi:hypothetical protein